MLQTQKLAKFARPYRFAVVMAPLMMALEVAMDLMQPRLVQRIVDEGIAHKDMNLVVHSCLLMLGCAVVGTAGGIGCTIYSVIAGQGSGADLRASLFRKVQGLSFGNLDRLETGSIITRLTNDVNQLQNFLMMLLRMMVRAPLLIVGSVIMAVMTSLELSRLFLILIPIVVATLFVVFGKSYPIYGEVQKRLDSMNTVMQENLSGIRVVKAFARSLYEIGRFRNANNRLMDQNILAVRLSSVTMPFMMLTLNAGVVAAVWIGGVRVVAGEMPVGHVIAFVNYLAQSLMSLMMISMMIIQTSQAEASARRVSEILDDVPDVPAVTHAAPPSNGDSTVVFDDVTFSYDADEPDPILCNISLTIPAGQTVAILGATGSGKSSLVNLIPRFYEASEGTVTLGGVDVREIPEELLRRRVAIALQESVLFSGTIRDNIRYGRPDATEAEVVEAATIAQAKEFIDELPDHYEAIVGQRGVNLSGGQKQRLAIARALLARSDVLILDDSTSAVDVNTESRIREGLARFTEGQTVIIVAQRVSSARGADKIVVLDDGRVVAEGTHDDLMESSEVYREIYESQTESKVSAHA
ncbi:MAG TPA: ABC transporter ATP-binding protein [Capsulimonadaceae bacterium]|jgi:ATP-binding cassette subfamily B protein